MMIPTIHLNGTAKGELIRQVSDAVAAVEAAVRALDRAYPHGRDYYKQGDHAPGQAMREHAARIDRLNEVKAELAEIWAGIAAQAGNRSEI